MGAKGKGTTGKKNEKKETDGTVKIGEISLTTIYLSLYQTINISILFQSETQREEREKEREAFGSNRRLFFSFLPVFVSLSLCV